jgi:hypothetical protein
MSIEFHHEVYLCINTCRHVCTVHFILFFNNCSFYVDELFCSSSKFFHSLFVQVLSDKLPEVLDFSRDLANLEPASKVV